MKLSGLLLGLVTFFIVMIAPASVAAQDSQLVYGQQVSGFISRNDDADRYRFYGAQGDVISITARRTDGNLDPMLQLIDNGFRTLTSSDDYIGTDAAIVNYVLPYTGPYLIRVVSFDKTNGSYVLNFYNGEAPTEKLTVNETRTIFNGNIGYGQTIRDILNNARPFARWQFFGNAGDEIAISMLVDDPTPSAFDPQLYLFDPTGKLLAFDDDSGGGLNAAVRQNLNINGAYTIMVTSYKQRTFGAYRLVMTLENPDLIPGGEREPVLTAPPADSTRLGGIDVQTYCRSQGYNASLINDGRNWACTIGGAVAFVLQQRDYSSICRSTYTNVENFAVLSGDSPTVAYNWACFTTQQVILPTPTPPPSQYAGTLRPRDNVEVHVRSGPGTGFESLGIIDWRQSFPYYEQQGDFYVIDYNGQRGYVSTRWATITLSN